MRLTRTVLGYPVVIEPLAHENGGGFTAVVLDLPGCMSDGETPEQALESVRDAIESWLDEADGSTDVPDGVYLDLHRLCIERTAELDELLPILTRAAAPR